ncbi:hypothetical protein G1H11_19735 [Phytoactinopolyspora alkaliphila]|uniref:Uncharacterized protein n=1 Tax=Phytoactinopolyspora alkaliphila TaxID=1783498 RepID=A0A6N9YR84_9ACTN|nr:hypothetical protein [Phytoactinopolyspora alkaliphila]NED97533.1 hypothetical protein [Phytoactinopolyspora alkaliphila]
MTRPHPLTAMREREWSQAWEEQQRIVDEQLNSQRGSWLPNVIERRRWGAMRWTSGRPSHAATSGRAVAETFVVLRPDAAGDTLDQVMETLKDPAPVVRAVGFGLQRHHVIGLVSGAAALGVVAAVGVALAGAGPWGMIIAVLLGAIAGAVAGGFAAGYAVERQRSALLSDEDRLRVVVGRYASKSWSRLVEAASALEGALPKEAGKNLEDPDTQTVEAIHIAMWEAAGLLLTSSDHTGVDVLAEGVERLERAHRGSA